MSVVVILSFCSVLDLKAPAHLDCRLLRRMRKRYWRVKFAIRAPPTVASERRNFPNASWEKFEIVNPRVKQITR